MIQDHDTGDENDHIVRCLKETYAYGCYRPCQRLFGHSDKHGCRPDPIRGIDRDCEECGAREGCFYERGFARCNGCGYPGQ